MHVINDWCGKESGHYDVLYITYNFGDPNKKHHNYHSQTIVPSCIWNIFSDFTEIFITYTNNTSVNYDDYALNVS